MGESHQRRCNQGEQLEKIRRRWLERTTWTKGDSANLTRHRPGNVCEHSPNWPVGKPLSSSFQYHLDAFFVFSPCRRAAKFKKDSNGHGISPCSSDLESLSANSGQCSSTSESGHVQRESQCPLWTNSGHRTAYSMTSSARPTSVFGTLRPSALAVLRLITNSYFVAA